MGPWGNIKRAWLDCYEISSKEINQVVVVVIEPSLLPLLLLAGVIINPKVFLDPTKKNQKMKGNDNRWPGGYCLAGGVVVRMTTHGRDVRGCWSCHRWFDVEATCQNVVELVEFLLPARVCCYSRGSAHI